MPIIRVGRKKKRRLVDLHFSGVIVVTITSQWYKLQVQQAEGKSGELWPQSHPPYCLAGTGGFTRRRLWGSFRERPSMTLSAIAKIQLGVSCSIIWSSNIRAALSGPGEKWVGLCGLYKLKWHQLSDGLQTVRRACGQFWGWRSQPGVV